MMNGPEQGVEFGARYELLKALYPMGTDGKDSPKLVTCLTPGTCRAELHRPTLLQILNIQKTFFSNFFRFF